MSRAEGRSPEWSVQELGERLGRDDRFFVLDVRNRDEFDAWRIEGRNPPPALNVPYFEMLEAAGADDFVDAVADYARSSLLSDLPDDRPILAVCAKGDTSAYVAEALRRLGLEAFNLRGGMRAWADHYEVAAVAESPELTILQVARPARGCLSWVVASDGEAVVIDPLRHVSRYLDLLDDRDLEVVAVLDSHAHADHLSGGPALAGRLGCPYGLHPYDGVHPIDLLPARIGFEYLRDGGTIAFGTAGLRALHIPGHTLGNLAFALDDEYLFTGDSIFIGSIARPDLGGQAEAWARLHHRSLNRLLELDDGLLVLPGHFSDPGEADADGLFRARLGELRSRNEGLRMAARSEAEFIDYIRASLPEFPDRYVEMKRANAGLVEVDEDGAAELELGKNICALAADGAAGT